VSYDPLTGEGYTREEAAQAWGQSMNRSSPRWQLRGRPGSWEWSFFDFGPWTGKVRITRDGFHWETVTYDDGSSLLSGVTTSVYEAYQSVEQNKEVRRA
jgi:hypothetical protein